jgi:hypothetical protein
VSDHVKTVYTEQSLFGKSKISAVFGSGLAIEFLIQGPKLLGHFVAGGYFHDWNGFLMGLPDLDRCQLSCLLIMTGFNGIGTGQWSKTLFAGPARRAPPILRCLIKEGAFRYPAFSVASVGIVDAAAIHCLALIHVMRFSHGQSPYGSNHLKKHLSVS